MNEQTEDKSGRIYDGQLILSPQS